jgi:uracil phosphoribosyltransferase
MLKIVGHAIVQERLTFIRKIGIDRIHFRAGIIEIGRLIGYEFVNTMEKEYVKVRTPLGTADGIKIKDKDDVVIIGVLRAAIPFINGILRVFKEAKVGVVGAWREDKPPFMIKIDYIKIPDLNEKIVILADPMIATGNTMSHILTEIKKQRFPKKIVIFNVICTEVGIEKIFTNHPEVDIFTCSVDENLNKDGYIIPGLGDAGDIAFGKPTD